MSVTDADNREVLEYDGSSGSVLRWYAYGLGPNGVLNQMNVPGSTRTVFMADLQGSIIGTFNSAGTLTKSAYQPYGGSAAAACPFGYTGQRIDPEVGGLYYYRARHYSPTLGKFMQPDPLRYSTGVNLYTYVGSDPLNRRDSSGLKQEQIGQPSAQVWSDSGETARVQDPYFQRTQGAMSFCLAGPVGCAVGTGITAGQMILGGAALLGGGAGIGGLIILNQDAKPPQSPEPTAPDTNSVPKPAGIPDNWIEKPSAKGGGTEWINPTNPNDRVRVMPGNPSSDYKEQQGPYVKDQNNGAFVDKNGQPIGGPRPGNTPESHIPYEDYVFKR